MNMSRSDLETIMSNPAMRKANALPSPAVSQTNKDVKKSTVGDGSRTLCETLGSLSISPSNDEAKLNKTEAQFLASLRANLFNQWIGVQCLTFKLGDDCRYTPDFITIKDGEMFAWEVKGFFRDDAKVKIKVAARMYRFIKFVIVKKTKAGFTLTNINP